jgi:F-type H+-transporting ATPase subunit alpha
MSTVEDITKELEQRIDDYQPSIDTDEVGRVVSVADGIVRVSGLENCMAQEELVFADGTSGIALNLDEATVGAIILGEYDQINQGDEVRRTGSVISVPVGEDLRGRVVSSRLEPIDEKGSIDTESKRPVEASAPGVMDRQAVDQPLQTGIKAVDSMVPIGRGQRELIIGDRKTGKTTLAVDTIRNQKDTDVKCVYVAIGQKRAKVARLVAELREANALDYTTVVAATASDGAAAQYIAPYAATAQAESLMYDGEDVLVVYDDLSKHADAYRELSLLLRRPPGREAYPGDVFYLHSRLLERSAKLNDGLGGGSITSFPIIETKAGNISAYIPTNVISITDGQIYLESDLFNKGVRPAMNTGNSVSRVGSAAQIDAMKAVAGTIRTEMAQFRELESFTEFSSDLDEETQNRLNRGLRIREILKQPEAQPVGAGVQVVLFYAVEEGYIDEISPDNVSDFEAELTEYLQATHSDLLSKIRNEWSDNIAETVDDLLADFVDGFQADKSS